MIKILKVGLEETLRKLNITYSKLIQNLWLVSKLQNFSIRGLIEMFYEYLNYVLLNQDWFSSEKCFGFAND